MGTSRRRSLSRLTAAIAVLGTVLSSAQFVSAQAADTPVVTGGPGGSRTVTLITGDRVDVDAMGNRSIRPGPNRERTQFSVSERDGHHFVIPVDALRPIADGRLDERLFDIDTLLADNYDDAHTATLPLIVTYQPGLAPVALAGARPTATLAAVNGAAVAANRDGSAWQSVRDPGVRKVWLDGVRKPMLDKSAAQIGAPTAWQAGYTGDGVKVAVLDSGIDQTHPDLAGRVDAAKVFSDAPDGVDRLGHGTHLASIIGGNNAKYRGIASGARLLDGKIFDDSGAARDSWIIAGMQWAAEQGAKVVNLSLGRDDLPESDPLEDAVNALSAQHGTLFVVAAGNAGPTAGTVDSPGSADAALTVGAVDRADKITSFSGRGPRVGDGGVKPDITAPGLAIVAARSSASPGDGPYVADFGTSMAAAHVAGAAALLAQQHPDWSGEQLKDVLMASAKPGQSQTIFQEGTGRVDAAAAITQTLSTSPASAHLGVERLPDTGGQTFTKTVTYRNTGTAEQSLDLKVVLLAPDGKLSTAVSASPAKLVVPAGGTATATYAADVKLANQQGLYAGMVIATGTGAAVRTPIVFGRSEQTYEVKVTQIGLDGGPAVDSYARFVTHAAGARQYQIPASNRLRLPKGEYSIDALLVGDNLSWLFQPTFTVTGDTEVVIDYRRTKPLKITPPTKARSTFADVALTYGDFATGLAATDITRTATAGVGAPVPGTALTTKVQTQWLGDNGEFYGLAYFGHGALPTGFTKHPSKRDLAHVRADLRSTAAGRLGMRGAFPYPTEGSVLDSNAGYETAALPRVRDEYYTTEADGAQWTTQLVQLGQGTTADSTVLSPVRRYRAGRDYTEVYNQGVFGPVFPPMPKGQAFLSRTKETIRASMSLFGDGGGNAGDAAPASRITTLYKGDAKIGDWTDPAPAVFTVPAEEGDYKLVADSTRAPGTADTSTRVTATWTFHSGHTDTLQPLPISTLRVLAGLDKDNAARKGKTFPVRFALQAQGDTDTRSPRSLTVEVSYDSGKTWQKAPVFGSTAVLSHPDAVGTVSVRAKSADRSGQSVELTIIDAYKLR
ncbi:S8 family serine peptidase [Actinokineospora auranticolor]|uniref:Subtilase family protein n=1 Tax=Actinokineospora auranticolor TaxID=155976 RepID=A0A2S6H1E1_9PSEU|nr:S8 family serine peptidase [Actinokineospora auranticolor]PPK71227.1 subtilase family protein [Actinokineospora auranticolor]